MDNDPKHTSKVVAKWLKDNKVKVLGRTEKVCVSKEAYKPDSITPALSGEICQNLLWEACGRRPETFDPS